MEMSAFIICMKPCKCRVQVTRWWEKASFNKTEEPAQDVNKMLALSLADMVIEGEDDFHCECGFQN